MAWLSGYSKRKELKLTGGASGAQTDFQLKLAVSYESAMQGDFDDLRFTQVDGTTLVDAWSEVIVADTSATVWVEFPTTPANTVEQTYYMYYGNAGAASDWDIGATFIFGDDFSGDLTKWSNVSALSAITAGVVKSYPTANYGGLKSVASVDISSPRMMEARVRMNNPAAMQNGVGFFDRTDATTWYHHPSVFLRYMTSGARISAVIDTTGTHSATDIHIGIDTNFHRYQILVDEGAYPSYWYDSDTLQKTVNVEVDTYYLWIPKAYNTNSSNEWTETDWIFVRKYAANPPTYAFGAEQSVPTGNPYWYYNLLKRRN